MVEPFNTDLDAVKVSRRVDAAVVQTATLHPVFAAGRKVSVEFSTNCRVKLYAIFILQPCIINMLSDAPNFCSGIFFFKILSVYLLQPKKELGTGFAAGWRGSLEVKSGGETHPFPIVAFKGFQEDHSMRAVHHYVRAQIFPNFLPRILINVQASHLSDRHCEHWKSAADGVSNFNQSRLMHLAGKQSRLASRSAQVHAQVHTRVHWPYYGRQGALVRRHTRRLCADGPRAPHLSSGRLMNTTP